MSSCINVPRIMLPSGGFSLEKWAVIACDQYTSQPDYWRDVKEYVGGEPSAYNCILPEVYLDDDADRRIAKINADMCSYSSDGVLHEFEPGFVLIERQTPFTKKRLGLVAAVDLECYSYSSKERPPIRATEGTIIDRLPPRMQIRANAPLELSHIMLLFDDRKHDIMPWLYAQRDSLKKLYDFELMMGGGHVRGWHVRQTAEVLKLFSKLLEPNLLYEKYNTTEELLFVAGDGNHSLAAAKAWWELIKPGLSEEELQNHPARYALCELINIHDEGLLFHPIHRAIFNVEADAFLDELSRNLPEGPVSKHTVLIGEKRIKVDLPANTAQCYAHVQGVIDAFVAQKRCEADYIHGDSDLAQVCSKAPGSLGILMPALDKSQLFEHVIKYGALPRKTFSMGEAQEKRYYIEARRIVKR